VQAIVEALNEAFYLAFGNVEPTNKRILLALDLSGSMQSPVAGIQNLSCREAAAALALVTATVEPNTAIGGFTGSAYPRDISGTTWSWDIWRRMQAHRMNATLDNADGFALLNIGASQRLDGVVEYIKQQRLGPTDCALPMLWARKERASVDTFVVITDNETWQGAIHPFQALEAYRRDVNPQARLAVLAMSSGGFTIANPNDAGMLDLTGFDSNTPAILSEFMAGNI
jgi:60 kDa SS-A/Ro ribonucleoprotein